MRRKREMNKEDGGRENRISKKFIHEISIKKK